MKTVSLEDNRENGQGLCCTILGSKIITFSGFFVLYSKTQSWLIHIVYPSQMDGRHEGVISLVIVSLIKRYLYIQRFAVTIKQ